MKNTEFCFVNKEKLIALINKVIGFYEIVDDHWMLVECSLNHGERARKTDMRALNNTLISMICNQLEYIGCTPEAIKEFDEDEMFENIFDNLDVVDYSEEDDEDNEYDEESVVDENAGAVKDIKEFFNKMSELINSDKPISVCADIYINESNKGDERA